MGFLTGKRALIVGVASDRSIAWGIAQAMHREGAELAFTYVNEKFKDRVQPLAESLGSKLVLPLDVTSDSEILLLAMLINLTPGSVALDVSADRKVMYVHVMYIDSPDAARSEIKYGFERRVRQLLG